MLGVTFTSRAELGDGDSRRKKEKKEKRKKDKKEKKEKRDKRDKKHGTGSDSEDTGSEGDVPKPRQPSGLDAAGASGSAGEAAGQHDTHAETASALQREDWMTKPMRREAPKPTPEEEKEKRRQEAAEAEPEIIAGLRMMKKADPAAAAGGTAGDAAAAPPARPAAAAAAASAAAGGGGRVGDGGASWRLKALRRAQEQAKTEGRSLQEVVGERWGSLAALTEGLSSTAAADGRAHLRAAAERRRAGGEGPSSAVLPHYLQDVHSDRAQMLRPSDDASLRWRRDGRDGRGGRRGDDADRPTGRDPRSDEPGSSRDGRGAEEGGEEAGRGADRDRGRGGDRRSPPRDADERQRERERDGGRDRERDQAREPDDDRSRRERERERDGRPQDRGERDRPEHGRERDRDRDKLRHRERDVEWERGRGERGNSGRGGRAAATGPRPSREQAAALKELAGSLNNFADDGSFMERFMAVQGGGKAAAVKEEGPEAEPSDRDDADADERRRQASRGDQPGPSRMDVDSGPGPAAAGGGGGGGNRAIAAMLRGRAGGGGGGAPAGGEGGRGRDEEGADAVPPAAAPRRAPLFVGGDAHDRDDDGRGAGPSGDGDGAAAAAQPSGLGNKSAAELLRARLKGLPPPSASAAAAAGAGAGASRPAVKREPGGDDDQAGPGPGPGSSGPRREVVQLPLVDASGRAVRGAFGREAAGADVAPNAGRRAGTKPPQRYNRETGEKERYFADDDKVDLQTMLRRAKYGDDDMNMDEHLAANIAKKRKFRGTDLDVDAEYDFDGGIEMYESRSKRGNAEAQRARERSRQVADLRRQAAAEAGCPLCVSNPKRPAHLTVAVGTAAYLCLPHRGRLVRGHCCIAPAEHCPSIRGLDEVAWTEVKNFIKCLIRMYGAQGQSVLFMETYMTRGGGRQHAVLDVVPMTERQLEKARGYFKKAILEAESEWSTHHAKACIETTAQKGLRESIPPNFPYFYVQFGYGSGYVHVIDDESKFDPNFGRQVLIGLLDLPPELTHARQKSESAAAQQQWVREFEAAWDPYDWTRQLAA